MQGTNELGRHQIYTEIKAFGTDLINDLHKEGCAAACPGSG